MSSRKLIIDRCYQCPSFESHIVSDHYGKCYQLKRRVETSENIPEDCPLEKVEEEINGNYI